MPTGYTADIAKGITFNQFAMNCARAFGACIMMRDEPSNAEIPEAFQPSDYHEKALKTTRDEIAALTALSPEAADLRAAASYAEEVAYRDKAISDADALKEKYEHMLTKVEQWEPPTPDHVGMKEFMVQQIKESINWDCDKSYYRDRVPVRLSGEKWRAQKLAALTEKIEYHEKHHAEEVELTNSRNAWVKALRGSLS